MSFVPLFSLSLSSFRHISKPSQLFIRFICPPFSLSQSGLLSVSLLLHFCLFNILFSLSPFHSLSPSFLSSISPFVVSISLSISPLFLFNFFCIQKFIFDNILSPFFHTTCFVYVCTVIFVLPYFATLYIFLPCLIESRLNFNQCFYNIFTM